jgi:hypothetical protein
MGKLGDGVNFLSLRVSLSPHLPILFSECLTYSDRPDLLPHKGEIADPKTEEGDGHNRN